MPQRSAGVEADPAVAQSGSGGTGPMAADRGGVSARWGHYTSYKVAKNVVEFSTSIARAQLRPGYGAGFLGAPLNMVEPDDIPRERERGGRHGTSRTDHDQGAGNQRPV